MTSWVELGNLSLSKIGHFDFINSLTDGTKAASLIDRNYKQVRDATLRAHLWNFAKKRVVLAPSVSTPAFGSGNFFPHQSDWIRTAGTDDPYLQWTEEASGIFCNATAFNHIYIYRVDDPSLFDSLFIEAYTTNLAKNISIAMTGDKKIYVALAEMYKDDLRLARSINGQEQGFQQVVADDFISARA